MIITKGNMRLTIPNQLTILRILLTPVFLYFFLRKTPTDQLIGSVVFTVAALTDWYDGWYARKFGVISRVGQFMDPLADKILVISALIAFAVLNYVYAWMVWIIVIRDIFVTTNRIIALSIGKPIITHILAKWKTALQMVTIFVILIYTTLRNYFLPDPQPYTASYFDFIGILMITVTILTIVSGIIYVVENKALLLYLFRKIIRW
ncbi:MAG: CDP-diacylglycerol--glycerol-3-phosphate 3-phosphatidyltransferase [Calditrichaeota bacterium]|nr:MAG: CDP-diacylglycerol--glycerol-3-phosphate 3-phosphatidyltransferase [Calditrichota bacterium]